MAEKCVSPNRAGGHRHNVTSYSCAIAACLSCCKMRVSPSTPFGALVCVFCGSEKIQIWISALLVKKLNKYNAQMSPRYSCAMATRSVRFMFARCASPSQPWALSVILGSEERDLNLDYLAE